MLHRPTHDDHVRAHRARVEDPPVQLTRELVDEAVAASAAKVAANPPFRHGFESRYRALAAGSMKAFLAHARTIQKLPSFARRLRE
jgi:hypothetical protein